MSIPEILSYIVFLHQTTTFVGLGQVYAKLSYIVFLHQTTTILSIARYITYCLISSFYIKPQLTILIYIFKHIVLYRLSTSNHNPSTRKAAALTIVLYRLSTSNHNCLNDAPWHSILSYIVFLHQTTTRSLLLLQQVNCLISSFYIKPQLMILRSRRSFHCLISSFYIKPQLVLA